MPWDELSDKLHGNDGNLPSWDNVPMTFRGAPNRLSEFVIGDEMPWRSVHLDGRTSRKRLRVHRGAEFAIGQPLLTVRSDDASLGFWLWCGVILILRTIGLDLSLPGSYTAAD